MLHIIKYFSVVTKINNKPLIGTPEATENTITRHDLKSKGLPDVPSIKIVDENQHPNTKINFSRKRLLDQVQPTFSKF